MLRQRNSDRYYTDVYDGEKLEEQHPWLNVRQALLIRFCSLIWIKFTYNEPVDLQLRCDLYVKY